MPFQGLGDAVTVFDAEFYDRDPLPTIDFERIQLPPRKRFFSMLTGTIATPSNF